MFKYDLNTCRCANGNDSVSLSTYRCAISLSGLDNRFSFCFPDMTLSNCFDICMFFFAFLHCCFLLSTHPGCVEHPLRCSRFVSCPCIPLDNAALRWLRGKTNFLPWDLRIFAKSSIWYIVRCRVGSIPFEELPRMCPLSLCFHSFL